MPTLAERLIRVRVTLGHREGRLRITQAELAALLGVSPRSVWNYEHGETSPNHRDAAWLEARLLELETQT